MFKADFFKANRQNLLASLGSGALVAIPAYTQMQRRADGAFKFEQEANFLYLSGVEEPDWWLIISGLQNRTWLVRPEIHEKREVFDGSLNDELALETSGANAVIDRTEARQLLAKLKSQHSVLYTITAEAQRERYEHDYYGFALNPAHQQFSEVISKFSVRDCSREIAKLRAIKQQVEIKALQRAVDISIDGIKSALKGLNKLNFEYEFEALLSASFRTSGANHAYDPIVAVGNNGCVLHYQANNARLNKKQWLLFDAAAVSNYYSADITRTLPLGVPTKFEVRVYEAVLRVQKYAISLCQPGQLFSEYQVAVDQKMTEELLSLGIIKQPSEMREYFPHAISHGLGIDVHESLGGFDSFQSGMVLTVEPGIYVKSKGFAVRIEDDILITDNGPKVLSAKLPTDLNAISKLLKKR